VFGRSAERKLGGGELNGCDQLFGCHWGAQSRCNRVESPLI